MIVDIIILGILALSIYLGYRKGLIELGVKAIAVIVALVLTMILCKPISNLIINNTKLDEKIEQKIVESVEEENDIIQVVAKQVSKNIIKIGTVLVLYFTIKILLRFFTAFANLIAKLPILNQFNKLGGILFGALRGFLLIYIALIVIKFIGQINPENKASVEVQNSFIGKEMYSKNIIELFLE